LGLDQDRFTLLVNAASAGRPSAQVVLRELCSATELHSKVQVMFAAGRHRALAARVAGLGAPFPIQLLDWQPGMSDLLEAADAAFTKPGGMSVFEAIAHGVPILIDACEGVMPQELGLSNWLETAAIGTRIRHPGQLVDLVAQTSPAQWGAIGARARACVSGDAGTIANQLLELAGASSHRP
jgi:UDP-N-acetylglucosamine:LPS N-acetylglucosamine transferase